MTILQHLSRTGCLPSTLVCSNLRRVSNRNCIPAYFLTGTDCSELIPRHTSATKPHRSPKPSISRNTSHKPANNRPDALDNSSPKLSLNLDPNPPNPIPEPLQADAQKPPRTPTLSGNVNGHHQCAPAVAAVRLERKSPSSVVLAGAPASHTYDQTDAWTYGCAHRRRVGTWTQCPWRLRGSYRRNWTTYSRCRLRYGVVAQIAHICCLVGLLRFEFGVGVRFRFSAPFGIPSHCACPGQEPELAFAADAGTVSCMRYTKTPIP